MSCSPQRYLANNRNLARAAALAASSVLPVDDMVVEVPVARSGTAAAALTGTYTGAEEALYEIEVVDVVADDASDEADKKDES